MVTLETVEEQLKAAGCNFRFWGRSEVKELCEILLPGETIAMAVNGQYDAGFAMLCATDFRVLLIDKKPKYLTLKDIRFDMITELDFSSRMLNSTIKIYTPNKELRFTATNARKIRKLFTHTQHKVMEIRHHFMMQQFQQQSLAKNTPPGVIMAENASRMPQNPQYEQMQPGGQNQQLSQGGQYQALPQQTQAAQSANLYNPQSQHDTEEEHRRLAVAMGAAGLKTIVHNGQVIKEYMVVPFQQRWKKRPYGFSRDSLPAQTQQQQPS